MKRWLQYIITLLLQDEEYVLEDNLEMGYNFTHHRIFAMVFHTHDEAQAFINERKSLREPLNGKVSIKFQGLGRDKYILEKLS